MAQWRSQVDFGAFPGASHATVVVSAPGITADSSVTCSVLRKASLDHSEDEHSIEHVRVSAGDIVAGTSFTAHAVYDGAQMDPGPGGAQPRLYGLWYVGGEYTT